MWDEEKEQFVYQKPVTIQLQHSLVSISKWESKYHKPFLAQEKRSYSETMYYIKCMTLTQNVDDSVYTYLTDRDFNRISNYIDDPMTATWFSHLQDKGNSSEQVTSELIYYWMIAYNIPFECQKWHLNRLLTLIKVCSEKGKKQKKMSQREEAVQRSRLNAARRAARHSKG